MANRLRLVKGSAWNHDMSHLLRPDSHVGRVRVVGWIGWSEDIDVL